MYHSIRKSSISGILENVIKPNNYPVTIFFGTLNQKIIENFRATTKLPVNSETFARMQYEAYMDLLWKYSSIGLDDNTGYYGWSRFAMECAIARIPCVGSTEAVQDIFPELHTAPQDFVKQSELIAKLMADKKFYHEIVEAGYKRVYEILSDETLCKKLIEIFNKLKTSKTGEIPQQPLPEPNQHPHP
jgi:hypothetical protein